MGRRLATAFPTFTRWWKDPRNRAALRSAVRLAARIARAALRVLGAALSPAPVLGVLYMAGVTWLTLAGPLVSDEERILSAARTRILEGVFASHAGVLRLLIVELAAVGVVVGALLGVFAAGLVALVAAIEKRTPSRVERAASTLVIAAAIQAGAFAWSMSEAPQFYERSWNHAGGRPRAFQVLVATTLDPTKVALIAAAIVVAIAIAPALVRRAWSALRGGAASRSSEATERGPILRGAAALAIVVGAFAFLPPRAAIPAHPARAPGDRPNVIILAADSFRDDRLEPSITPHLVDLARRGTRFTRAYVTVPRTLPSWTTTLTSEWPHHHGIRTSFPRADDKLRPRDTIVSRFRDAGYATVAVGDYAGDLFRTIDLGFESVFAPDESLPEYIRIEILKRAKPLLPVLCSELGRWLFPSMRELPIAADAGFLADDIIDAMRRRGPRPLFLLGFFGAAHIPYAAPSPYFKRFTDAKYEGELKYDKLVWDPAWRPSPEEVHQLRGLYDGAIASVDDAVARVLAELDREHIADDTIVVVMGDHGQYLLEADRSYGHGAILVGQEATHIPLVVFDPRRASAHGRSVTDLVRDVDIAPTLCELAAIPCMREIDGSSLANALDGAPIPARVAYGETEIWLNETRPLLRIPYPSLDALLELDAEHGEGFVLRKEYEDLVVFGKHRMVFDGRWKLVYMPLPSGPRYALFDTVADPMEVVECSADHPDEVARLREALWRWMLEDPKMEERHGFLAPRALRVSYVDGDGIR